MLLRVSNLNFSYGSKRVVADFDINIEAGELVTLVAPSGAGKSTLFGLIARLHKPKSGKVYFEESEHNHKTGNLFMGFQDFDAFPWYTVRENILLMSRFRSSKLNERNSIELADRVGLKGELDHYPRELSGGMRKRLAFARCLASGARLLLLDEPFSSLDIKSRLELQQLTIKLTRETGIGVILATHDAQEAVSMGDRIVVCSGPPLEFRVEIVRKESSDILEEYMESEEYQYRLTQLRHAINLSH